MVDTVSETVRSKIMAAVGTKNTKPEILVRKLLHKEGYRFRIHRKDLPGRPDIILPKYKTAIFIHGCFWHRHSGCKKATTPQANAEFWEDKFKKNVDRDAQQSLALKKLGWKVMVIWECECKNPDRLLLKFKQMLGKH